MEKRVADGYAHGIRMPVYPYLLINVLTPFAHLTPEWDDWLRGYKIARYEVYLEFNRVHRDREHDNDNDKAA